MKIKRYSSGQIRRAIGALLSILSLSFFISAWTKTTWGISFLFVYLFGLIGYWLFLPLIFVTGLIMLFGGEKAKKIFTWKLILGFAILLLGVGLIGGYLSATYYRDNSLSLFDLYGTSTKGLKGQFALGKGVLDDKDGGGIILTSLASGLNLVGDALTITIIIIAILGAVFLIFYPFIMRTFNFASTRVRAHKAKKESEASIKKAEDEKRKALEKYVEENTPIENDAHDDFAPSPLEVEPEKPLIDDEKIPSRTALYHSDAVAEVSPVPQETIPETSFNDAMPSAAILDSSLQEAVFDPTPDGKPSPVVSKPTPKEKPIVVEEKPKQADFGEIVLSEKGNEPIEENEQEETPVFIEEPKVSQIREETVQEKPISSMNVAPKNVETTIAKEDYKENEESEKEIIKETPIVAEKPIKKEEPIQIVPPTKEEPKKDDSVLMQKEETNPGAKFGAIPAKARPPYEFPPVDLLKTYQKDPNIENQNKLLCQQRVEIINSTFQAFNVKAEAVSYTIGPSVTRYDIKVDPGTSVSSINRYVTDISARLGGIPTRFQEIIPGKTTSGLEIANEKSTTVSFKEVLEALPKEPKNSMYIPFGVDISGNYISADLTKFPHMLVAGGTGSGKSVFAHGIIASLIMRNRPEDLKLVLVDPKRVEMTKYQDIPHLLCPIIKEPSQAKVALDKLIDVMEARLLLFEFAGVRNIRDYNDKYCPKSGSEKLPFIVVFIDEYADLSDTCKNIGESVVRIAQKARAAGIHLIVATQRPSVNVITGVIKANLDVRVALRVRSPQDSITILNKSGAEDLNGYGDMLVDCGQLSHGAFIRCQGCFIQDEELEAITDFIKSQQKVVYDPNFTDLSDHSNDSKIQEENDKIERAAQREKEKGDLYEMIKADIMTQEYTSISKIQRTYSVGFPRAGKIFQRLQEEGIVGFADSQSSSKGAKVLIHDSSALKNGNEDFAGDNEK